MDTFNPFTYNPGISRFFIESASQQHVNAINQFSNWVLHTMPGAYDAIIHNRPFLFDAPAVVASGALSADSKTLKGLADASTDSSTVQPATDWGTQVLDFFKQALPSYYQAQAQKQILDINVARAEQGLPPVDSQAVAPQVNVGVSKGVQQLGYLAVGGLVLVGLFSAFKARK